MGGRPRQARVSPDFDRLSKSVISETEHGDKFVPDAPAWGDTISSIVCGRDDIVPEPNDFKVLRAGYPLYISDKGQGHDKRLGTLEVVGGRLQFPIKDGPPLTPELQARMQKRLDSLQTAFDH